MSKTVNVGGLTAVMYVLARTARLADPSLRPNLTAKERHAEKRKWEHPFKEAQGETLKEARDTQETQKEAQTEGQEAL